MNNIYIWRERERGHRNAPPSACRFLLTKIAPACLVSADADGGGPRCVARRETAVEEAEEEAELEEAEEEEEEEELEEAEEEEADDSEATVFGVEPKLKV